MKTCDKGYKGMCCCTCTSQLILVKHPWNELYKGSMSEKTGLYACTIIHEVDKTNKAAISEKEHGCCENWTEKEVQDD